VTVIDASTGHVVTNLPADNVYELGFSPLGTFIITWQRPVKDEEGNTTNNLKVWRTIDDNAGPEGQRNIVGAFVQKSQTGWNLQYTHDETFCARVVTNEVQFYESGNLAQVWNKLRLEGVSDFAVSPGQNHSVAVFVPEKKVRFEHAGAYILGLIHISRVNRQLSKSSTFLNSLNLSLRRHFSRETRFSSSGTTLVQA